MHAQNYPIDTYNGQTINTCTGIFYDSGGATGNYQNGENYTVTFCSDSSIEVLRIDFTSFNVENNYDELRVYYGNSVAGVPDLIFTNVLSSFSVSEQNPGDCISFRFSSDSSVDRPGWVGEISCLAPCNPPIAIISDDAAVNVCPDDVAAHTIAVDASSSYSTDSYNITNYIWTWGDGTTTQSPSPTATHTYPNDPAIYEIQLTVVTDNTSINPEGCSSTNAAHKQINILPSPIFDGTTSSPTTISCGSTVTLEGIASSQTITSQPPIGIGSDTALPDTTQIPFESTIDFTDYFPPGATLTNTCLPEISMSLEHSYAGDLEIILVAPSGEEVILFDGYGTPSITNDFFGYCVDGTDGSGPGCPAPYHIVNDGGVNWTDAAAFTAFSTPCAAYTGPCQTGEYFLQDATYNSYEPLTNLIGAELNGVWTIRIIDNLSLDDGYLEWWSINFPAQCYSNLEIVTPLLTDLTWSHAGTGAVVPTPQVFSEDVYATQGVHPCPDGEICEGNQLTNNITVGPFVQIGSYVYTLTAEDEFGCTYTQDVMVVVEEGTVEFNNLADTYCLNASDIPDLPSTSSNGIEGSWLPASIDASTEGETTYIFTPTNSACAPQFEWDITIEDAPNTSQIGYD